MKTRYPSLVILTFIALSACMRDQKYEASEPSDIRLELIETARWAMSAHNVQPWVVELDQSNPGRIAVYLETSRLLPATDPYSRQLMLSLGGFLALLEDAAATRGYAAEIALFPGRALPEDNIGSDFTSPVAVVTIDKSFTLEAPEYVDAVATATPKTDLQPVVLESGFESSLLALDQFADVDLRFVHEETELRQLKPILKEAFRLEMNHPPTLDESYDMTRRNNRQIAANPWGLSYRSGFRGSALGFTQFFETAFPMKREKWGLTGADNYDTEINRATSFLLITTIPNTRIQQIEAGIVFERVWRSLIHHEYAVLPASQPLQEYAAMQEYYRQIHDLYASPGETIQMIAAVGEPVEGFRAGFRLSTSDLLRDSDGR